VIVCGWEMPARRCWFSSRNRRWMLSAVLFTMTRNASELPSKSSHDPTNRFFLLERVQSQQAPTSQMNQPGGLEEA
jgi:hypothetical protein